MRDISRNGRLRWVIENQGFNTQKNGGYNLQHKYSRKDYRAMQNYYTLLQVAHMIMQLVEKLEHTKQMLKNSGMTLIAAIDEMVSTMIKEHIGAGEMEKVLSGTGQLRYSSAG